jgi:formylglycine-generating enzyme required for sulfatase activity
MLGLVWEWVEDAYRTDAYTQEPRVNPLIQDDTSFRVLRGGSYRDGPDTIRASIRNAKPASFQADHIGFRWVCSI